MTTVRAKFYCQEKSEVGFLNIGVTGTNLTLFPVSGGSEENKAFFKVTPSGKLELNTVSAEAAKLFEPGKAYFIDITLAE